MSIGVWVGLIALLGVDAETACSCFSTRHRIRAGEESRAAAQPGRAARSESWRGGQEAPAEIHDRGHRAGPSPHHVVHRHRIRHDEANRAPLLGGIFTSFLMELLVYPVIYEIWKWHFEVKPALSKPKELP